MSMTPLVSLQGPLLGPQGTKNSKGKFSSDILITISMQFVHKKIDNLVESYRFTEHYCPKQIGMAPW